MGFEQKIEELKQKQKEAGEASYELFMASCPCDDKLEIAKAWHRFDRLFHAITFGDDLTLDSLLAKEDWLVRLSFIAADLRVRREIMKFIKDKSSEAAMDLAKF